VGLLLTVLTVGVARLRAAHKRSLREEAEVEMAWDDAALNITVNPMEDTASCRPEDGVKTAGESDVDGDTSDDEMYAEETSDDDDEEEEEDGPGRHRLEWDNDL